MTMRQSALLFTGILVALGYLGAGLFYGYLLGFDTQTPLTCPACPNITGSGDRLDKFFDRTLIFGTLNAFLLVGAGWCLRGLVMAAKKVIRY